MYLYIERQREIEREREKRYKGRREAKREKGRGEEAFKKVAKFRYSDDSLGKEEPKIQS